MKVYDGANWITATSAGNTSLLNYRYVATPNQTTFSGTDANSATMSYTVNNIIVSRNGVVLDPTDYTATSGTSVVLVNAASAGDNINIVAFKSFTTADMVPASTGGTYAGAVQFIAGSASTPGISVSGDTNTGMFFPSADTIAFAEGGTEVMRIDSSGNVGIGTSSPSALAKLDVVGNIRINGNAIIGGANNSSVNMFAGTAFNTGGASVALRGISNGYNDGGMEFYTGAGATGAERMRIDSSGNLLVRTTTAGGLLTIDSVTGGTSSTKVSVFGYGSGLGYGIEFRPNTNTGATPCRFLNAAGTEVGFISTSSSGTTYSTTSDYRLKHTVAPLTIGLATVSALNPVTYKWNADDSDGEGFIAHELQEVIPHAVTGEKDAVNEDGTIKPQGVDYSKIVVHLVAAVQELKAQNDELKARITALEGAAP
jgi:hypothetical protein